MIELEWTENGLTATAELEWLSIWVEPLDKEGQGRFAWTIDVPVPGYCEEFMLVQGGVERNLAAAKDAGREAAAHLISMGVSKQDECWTWLN